MEAAPRVRLDTNIASYLIRSGNVALRSRLRAIPLALVSVSAITEAELLYGLARRPDERHGIATHTGIAHRGLDGGMRRSALRVTAPRALATR